MFGWLACLIGFLVIWHLMVTIQSIYVHRGIAHSYFSYNPALEEFFVFALWFVMGFGCPNWRQWYATTHRRHHMYSDTELDPHSPYHYTFKQLCYEQLVCGPQADPTNKNYVSHEEIKQFDFLNYSTWGERNIYWKYPKLGQQIAWIVWTALFGIPGFVIGAMYYYFSGELITWIGKTALHKVGYEVAHVHPGDRSKIVFPVSLFLGGEELHAHHHNDTGTAKFDRNWYELDLGWWHCRLFMLLGLMKLKR